MDRVYCAESKAEEESGKQFQERNLEERLRPACPSCCDRRLTSEHGENSIALAL